MSELIRMRQRIKAIETIKKITHAMRLVAMSTHSRLRSKKIYLEEYQKELTDLYARITTSLLSTNVTPINPPASDLGKALVILVGSQKGLCGNFNTNIYFFCEQELAKINKKNLSLITVGKKAHEYAQISYGTLIMSFDIFNQAMVSTIANTIVNHIITAEQPYESVILFSNYPKTFFIQKPQATVLIPFITSSSTTTQAQEEEYIWEQSSQEIVHYLINTMLYARIQELLFQSLIAEQAARFIAMDNSTRNATNLLDTMRLNYNKMRQAKITKELTDLIASF